MMTNLPKVETVKYQSLKTTASSQNGTYLKSALARHHNPPKVTQKSVISRSLHLPKIEMVENQSLQDHKHSLEIEIC